MTQTIDELDAITQVVQLYIDGAAGDIAKLRAAFEADARMYGHIGKVQHAMPITGFIDMVAGAKAPLAGPRYKAKIVSIHATGDAGVAVLAEQDYLGCDFIDYFSLARIDGQWKIVNKTYAHTGGQLPRGAPASTLLRRLLHQRAQPAVRRLVVAAHVPHHRHLQRAHVEWQFAHQQL
jgi:hypothetical protein